MSIAQKLTDEAFEAKVQMVVEAIHKEGKVIGLVFGPCRDIRGRNEIQLFETAYGRLKVQIDPTLGPDEWYLKMDAANGDRAAEQAIKYKLIEFIAAVERPMPGQKYHIEGMLATLARGVLTLMDRKDGIK